MGTKRGWIVVSATLGLMVAAGGSARAAEPPSTEARPTVTVDSGVLSGSEQGGVLVFRGVPYAAPPVGPLRWQPPQPAIAWQGERSATAAGPSCWQPADPEAVAVGRKAEAQSEDCLTLQVFAPKGARQAPVMVWLHAGGNVQGSSSRTTYDGSAFARDGIVLVAINYRLGPFGFFAHPALTRDAPAKEPLANYGLMDQLAALRWVQRNVGAFGGDPRNVTVFGTSAGGLDVLALMGLEAARGLFVHAIAESPVSIWDPAPSLANAEAQGAALAAKVGVAGAVTAAQLRAIPAERLIKALRDEGFVPTIDGRLMTRSIPKSFVTGKAAPVPLVIGWNSNEASILEGALLPLDGVPPRVRQAYAGDSLSEHALSDAIFTDRQFAAPVRWIARKSAQHAKTWLYRFSYVRVSQRQGTAGAGHAEEMAYVFDSWDALARQGALPAEERNLAPEDRSMATLLHSCWVAFARTGQPACQGAPTWPPYASSHEDLLDFGPVTQVRQHLRQKQLDALDRAAGGAAAESGTVN